MDGGDAVNHQTLDLETRKLLHGQDAGWDCLENVGDPIPKGFSRFQAQRGNEVVAANTLAEFASRLRKANNDT